MIAKKKRPEALVARAPDRHHSAGSLHRRTSLSNEDPRSSGPRSGRSLDDRDLATLLEASEAFTRGLLAAVPAGVVHVAADGAIRTANAEALDLLGLSYDELSKRYTQDFDPETIWEDGSPCSAADYPVTRALMTGEPQGSVTIGVKRPRGDIRWCVFKAVPVKDEATGAVTGAVVTFHDVTDRILVAQTLRASEAKLKAIVEAAPDTIFTVDRKGVLTFLNRLAPNVDVSRETLIGSNVHTWMSEKERPIFARRFASVIDDGATVEFEAAGRRSVDPNLYLVRIGPIVTEGRITGAAGTATVITEQKRAETERARLASQLHEARRLEALGRLAGGIAHDFNNLLTIIRASVDLISDRAAADPRIATRAREIGEAADRGASLTRKLLAFGRQQPLQPKVLDPGEVVEGVVPMLSRLLDERVRLVVERAPGVAAVRADPIELERVVVNLVTNARDAMPLGGTCTVSVRDLRPDEPRDGLPEGPCVVLEVADTGHGMDQEAASRAFEPFFTTKEIGQGTGLGLATVHGIVTQTGGVVRIATSRAGTTFRVVLPATDERPEQRPAALESRPRAGRGQRVLVVEDDPKVRNVCKLLLEGEGYRVLAFDSAERALALSDEELAGAQLLLADVVMPKLGGPEMAHELRRRAPALAVLLMSGHVRTTIGPLPPGFDFISKPFEKGALLEKVEALLATASV